MGVRKNPPSNAVSEIRRLAAAGSTYVGIAKHFKVAKETLTRWLDDDPKLAESFEQGKDEERENLHNALSKKALAGDIVAAMFLLKARHKYDDKAGQRTDVNVGVTIAQPVLYVKDHGSDEEWAARAAAQQRGLTLNAASPNQPAKTPELKVPVEETQKTPEAYQPPFVADTPPSWTAPQLPARVPAYAPPEWKQNA